MDDIILPLLRIAGYILWLSLDAMFYQIFYYIGVVPVWMLSLGKLPSAAPHKLSKTNRRIYGVIGFVFTLLLFWYYLKNTI
jgi:hypothetical protein